MCEYVSKDLELPSHISIRVRIYANMKGLASAYCYNKILDSADDLYMFVRGFNMGYPMCDFVDAGDGKECADSKLKGNVKNSWHLQLHRRRKTISNAYLSIFQPRYGRCSVPGGHIRRIRRQWLRATSPALCAR